MDRRDQELLDKQLWGVNPYPPSGLIVIVFAMALVAGMAIGSLLFSHESNHTQIASHDATNAITQINSNP